MNIIYLPCIHIYIYMFQFHIGTAPPLSQPAVVSLSESEYVSKDNIPQMDAAIGIGALLAAIACFFGLVNKNVQAENSF